MENIFPDILKIWKLYASNVLNIFFLFFFSHFFLIENSVYRVHSGRYHVFVLLETVRMFEMVTGTCPKAAGVLEYHKLPRISIFSIFTNLLHVKNLCSFFSVCNIGYVEENIKIFFYARHAFRIVFAWNLSDFMLFAKNFS